MISRAITAAMLAGLTAAALCLAVPARADVFMICPDGQEGVVGGHTTCAFAQNVRRAFYASGISATISPPSQTASNTSQPTALAATTTVLKW